MVANRWQPYHCRIVVLVDHNRTHWYIILISTAHFYFSIFIEIKPFTLFLSFFIDVIYFIALYFNKRLAMGNKPEEKKEYGKFGVQVRKAKIIYNLQLIIDNE
jgi:hypothetical protein